MTTVYLLSPDFHAYEHGIANNDYHEALAHTDYQLGRVFADMERAGLLDKIVIGMVADHSQATVNKHFDAVEYLLKDLRLKVASKTLWENTSFEKRLAYYQQYPAVIYGGGERYLAITLRRPNRDQAGKLVGFDPWPSKPAPEDLFDYPTQRGNVNLVSSLASQPAIDVVAYQVAPNCVRLRRSSGEVEFSQPDGRGGQISYRVISGTDPLGWHALVPADLLAGRPASPRQWLQATYGTNYPDLPAQILAYFSAYRAGDIAVFAQPGWDFSHDLRGGHGGLQGYSDMLVPMLLAGPGVPHGQLAPARTVDLAPTILGLLGRQAPPQLDGIDLLSSAAAQSHPSQAGLIAPRP